MKSLKKIVQFSSSKKGAKWVIFFWIVIMILLSFTAPGSKEYASNSSESSISGKMPSEIAQDLYEEEYPSDDGLTALLVFHREGGLKVEDREKITSFSEWLTTDDKPEAFSSVLPFHQFNESIQNQMVSKDQSTLIINASLKENIDSDVANQAFDSLRKQFTRMGATDIQFEITGPAGISADTVTLFKNADFVLMITTILLIFFLLMVIYRSPIIAIIPVIIALIAYGVIDRILGIAGKWDWFTVDSASISIMLVLLFAVITDYSLFIFSRYRSELKKYPSHYEAMHHAATPLAEPIFFSGGTILMAILTLFFTVFKPYNHFAPVFAVAVILILLAGLTLIPSMFALFGRKAFWPFIPQMDAADTNKHPFWEKASQLIVTYPKRMAVLLLIIFGLSAYQFSTISPSYNLLKSFPEDLSSRVGFEILEENYPAGQLAPLTVLVHQDQIATNNVAENVASLQALAKSIEETEGISTISPSITDEMVSEQVSLPKGFQSDSLNSFSFQIILDDHPYEQSSMDTVESLLQQKDELMKNAGFDSEETQLYLIGQTAKLVDIQSMNQRDTIVLITLVTLLLIGLLSIQTKSFKLAFLMVATILLSYFASLGFSWLIFKYLLGLDAISYRIPVYTFVFMVALGIDYNIMLLARIKERAQEVEWIQAVKEGVTLTGGVISSAGVILAATFAVLITQPLQELYLFGMTMAIGILLDTFVVRGFLLPTLLVWTTKKRKITSNCEDTLKK